MKLDALQSVNLCVRQLGDMQTLLHRLQDPKQIITFRLGPNDTVIYASDEMESAIRALLIADSTNQISTLKVRLTELGVEDAS